MGCCTIDCRTTAVAVYTIVIGVLKVIAGIVQLSRSTVVGASIGALIVGLILVAVGVVLLYGMKQNSRGLVTIWLGLYIAMTILIAVGVCSMIYVLVKVDQKLGHSEKEDFIRRIFRVFLAAMLVDFIISIACIATVFQFRRLRFDTIPYRTQEDNIVVTFDKKDLNLPA